MTNNKSHWVLFIIMETFEWLGWKPTCESQSLWSLLDHCLSKSFSKFPHCEMYYISKLKDRNVFNFVCEFIFDYLKIYFLLIIMFSSYFCWISYGLTNKLALYQYCPSTQEAHNWIHSLWISDKSISLKSFGPWQPFYSYS